MATRRALLEEAPQHPRGLLVHLEALGEKVSGSFISRLVHDREHGPRRADYGLVALYELAHRCRCS